MTVEELAESEALAYDLMNALGLREGAPQTAAQAAVIRQRAFTLFMKAYSDARRAAVYLRWHKEDADEFAPSLYAGRSNGRKKPEEETLSAANGAPASSTSTAAPAPQAPAQAAPATAATHAVSNTPSNNPFA